MNERKRRRSATSSTKKKPATKSLVAKTKSKSQQIQPVANINNLSSTEDDEEQSFLQTLQLNDQPLQLQHADHQQQQQLGPLLTELPQEKRWSNWRTRGLWTAIMLGFFVAIILSGPIAIIMLIVGISTVVFKEVIAIALVPSKEKKLPWFRVINWYFLMVTNYFLYGETLFQFFDNLAMVQQHQNGGSTLWQSLAVHHRFYSYVMYCVGIVGFVINLKKGHYKFQFLQFFWTHMTLLLVTIPPSFIILLLLHANIGWFLLPVLLVVVNDVMAYMGGFFFGRTRLIRLSPKKTWEGFVVGLLCTLVFSYLFARVLTWFPFLYCPVKQLSMNAWTPVYCEKPPLYVPISYKLAPAIRDFTGKIFTQPWRYVSVAPIQLHAIVLGLFASVFAPFGGFFASGFKRAFKLKDFGDSIPGHGGVTDRMDCQFIMGVFAYFYYASFLKEFDPVSVSSVFAIAVGGLNRDDLSILHQEIGKYLTEI